MIRAKERAKTAVMPRLIGARGRMFPAGTLPVVFTGDNKAAALFLGPGRETRVNAGEDILGNGRDIV